MFKGGFNLGKFPSIRSSNEQLSHDSFNSGDRGENFLLRFEQLTNPLLAPRDRRRPRTAFGLDHIPIAPDRFFPEALQISNRPEPPTDEPLNLMGSPADLSTRCLAPNPPLRRAREHSILRRNPTLP